ncbi:MAG: YajQ family cyclic di-GMP-binding protein [Candidatus Margulisiibacteriota bacterium]
MALDHSFDIVSRPNLQEVDNAIQMAIKEISTRFDFKGSVSKIEKIEDKIKLVSDDAGKLKQVVDVLQDKLAKRKIPLKFFEYGKVEEALGGTVKQEVAIKQGIPHDRAKEIVKLIKGSGLKVQAQIQEDKVRVFGKKLDDLQAVMQKLRAADLPIVLQFDNYR